MRTPEQAFCQVVLLLTVVPIITCQYHIVWVPKYRIRILEGKVAIEVYNCIRAFTEQKHSEIVELNIQNDHVHLLVMVPPKVSISDYVGMIKGRTAIRVFNKFKNLKKTLLG